MHLLARTKPQYPERYGEILVTASIKGGKTDQSWPAKDMLPKIEEAAKHPDAIAARERNQAFDKRIAEREANRHAAAEHADNLKT